jgi:hypothetical protein
MDGLTAHDGWHLGSTVHKKKNNKSSRHLCALLIKGLEDPVHPHDDF